MYKLVFLDMDETLLTTDKKISEENKRVIRECAKKGVKFVIATGRPRIGINDFINLIPDVFSNSYSSNFNGGMIYDLTTNECIIKNGIKGSDIKRIYQESLRLGVHIHAYDDEQNLSTPLLSPYTEAGAKLNKITWDIVDFAKIDDDKNYMKGMFVDDPEKIEKAMKNLDSSFYNDYAVFRSAPHFLEMVNKKATKGQALIELSNYLGIDIKDTIAFGDSENDLSMICAAGLGICMENGFENVKEHADFVTLSNNNDGVAYALKKFILEQ